MESVSPSYKGHRYPVEVIAHCVWLYFRFPLSLPRGRGADAPARRDRLLRDGPPLVRQVRSGLRRRPAPPPAPAGDKWHLDEVFIKVNGEQQYLWRAVDQDGNVLDILVQTRRDARPRPGGSCARLMKKTVPGAAGAGHGQAEAPTAPPTARSCPPSSTARTRA